MKKRIALLLAGALLLTAAGCTNEIGPTGGGPRPEYLSHAVAEAVYPEMAPYPDEMAYYDEKTGEYDDEGFSAAYDAWREARKALRDRPEGYADGLESFWKESAARFLTGEEGENQVYSPLNVYMALAMLAEVTGGESREEILHLLGARDMEALRTQAGAIWKTNYLNDGATTSILAGSLWMNEKVEFVPETVNALAEHYYASSFRGEMGSEAFNKALQGWLNEETGGMLTDQTAGIELDPETVLAIATTLYYRAKWSSEFSPEKTEEGTFHAPDGEETCGFMHKSSSRTYYWSDCFSAVGLPLNESGKMWFLLPDEGVAPEDLLTDGSAMDFLLADGQWEESKFLKVNLAVPKFDVSAQTDLIPGLKAMGVEEVFDFERSDFTPLTEQVEEMAVTQARHGVRVTIDEEGVAAAAYTVIVGPGAAAPPEEEVDFVLDRPFLFGITGREGLPLFVGVVNHPQ